MKGTRRFMGCQDRKASRCIETIDRTGTIIAASDLCGQGIRIFVSARVWNFTTSSAYSKNSTLEKNEEDAGEVTLLF